MHGTETGDDVVTIILNESMIKVIDVFRDLHQNFTEGSDFLLSDVQAFSSFNHLFANILAHADDEIVTSVLTLYRNCIGSEGRFVFKPLGSALASADEIALLILLSAAQNGRYGLAGEAALRLGCRESLQALRSAYEFASWLSATGLEIGAIDRRLMQERPAELADSLIDSVMEKLEFRTASSRLSQGYGKLIGR